MKSCPVRDVRSLVTIDNERRQSGLRLPPLRRRTRPHASLSSVAVANVTSRGGGVPPKTIVATCLRDEKSKGAPLGSGGRLSVALVGPDDRVQMRVSAPGREFNTVGIVPSSSDCGCVNLLAVGDNRKLWAGPVDIDADRRTGIELRECTYREPRTSDSPRKKAKYEVPDWTRVDTFTPMLERDDVVVTPSSQECSPRRKGKQSDMASGMHLSPRAFVLATRLNTKCPPTLMELALGERPNCCSWLRLPGLDDLGAPITSVFFASKERCRAIWAKLSSSMGQPIQDEQRGIILLGLGDGSLMASIVTETDEGDLAEVTRAVRLIKLATAEPLISIQLLEKNQQHEGEGATEQVLLCTGALGNILSLKSNDSDYFTFETTLPSCEGRWTSLTCVGFRTINEDHCYVTFVGSNDSRKMFACSLALQPVHKDDQQEAQQDIHLLPSPPRIASVHGPQSCLAGENASSAHFVCARVDGRVCLAALLKRNLSSDRNVSHGTITVEAKITSGGSDSVVPKSTPDLKTNQDDQLVHEIRGATRIASRITEDTLTVSATECDGRGIFGCSMSANNLDHANQAPKWATTHHLLQPNCASPRTFSRPIKEAKPICYRRRCDGVPVKVVFGGTSSSYANAETHSSSQVNVVPVDANPIAAFSSMSLIYSDGRRSWFRSDAISRSTESNSSSTACRSSDEVVVGVSLVLGSRTLDLLSGVSDRQASQLPRVDAEGLIKLWYQRNIDACPVSKEELWLDKRNTVQNAPSNMLPGTAHCCLDSMELINVPSSLQNVYTCRLFRGVGPVAVVLRQTQDDVPSIDFALGSMGSLPSNLPLLRQAILSRVLADSKNVSNKDLSRKVDLFYTQISHKQTSKLIKYISRQADSLMARLESSDNSFQDELERAALSLYDTLRDKLKLTF